MINIFKIVLAKTLTILFIGYMVFYSCMADEESNAIKKGNKNS